MGPLHASDAHHATATVSLTRALDDGERLAMAVSAFAECLVSPGRRSERAIQIVKDAVGRFPGEIVDPSPGVVVASNAPSAIAIEAARLRARHRSLRLPDALVIATAVGAGVDRLITTDDRWPTRRPLRAEFEIVRI